MVRTNRRGDATARRHLQQWAFSKLYTWGDWLYDPLTRALFGHEWHRWRKTIVPLVQPGPVLDVACGTGALLPTLAAATPLAVGVDASPAMLRAARRRSNESFKLVQADARALPFREASFGSVVATFPAEFIALPEVLDEIARVIRPGGTFAVVMGGHMSRWSIWRLPIRAALRLFYGRRREQAEDQNILSHPLLPGRWAKIETSNGYAGVWIATRSGAALDG